MPGPKLLLARRGLLICLLLALLAWGATMIIWAPGLMSSDSCDQLAQARSMQLLDDHPVLMALIWHVTDRVLPGPLGFFALVTALYWVGLALLFSALDGPLLARAVGTLAVGFFPPGFINFPIICKDSLMQAALVAAVACLILPTTRWRAFRHVLGALLFMVAIGARHNGAAAVWPLLAIPLLALPVFRGRPRWLRLAASFGASLVLTYAMSVGVYRSLSPLSKKTNFWQMIPVFDLAGMSLNTGEVLVEPEAGVLTPGMGLDEIRRFYQSNYVNRLYYCMPFRGRRCAPLFRHTQNPKHLAALSSNWLRAIASHPAAYLKHRWEVVKPLIGLEQGAPGAFYYSDNPRHALAREYPPRRLAVKSFAWFDRQVPSFWFHPWLYCLIGCTLIPVTLRQYLRGGPALPMLLVLSGLSYMLGLFITTGSSPYRYTVWTTFSVVLALVILVLAIVGRRRIVPIPASKGTAIDLERSANSI